MGVWHKRLAGNEDPHDNVVLTLTTPQSNNETFPKAISAKLSFGCSQWGLGRSDSSHHFAGLWDVPECLGRPKGGGLGAGRVDAGGGANAERLK